MARFPRTRVPYGAIKAAARQAARSTARSFRRRKPKTDKLLLIGGAAVLAFLFKDKIKDVLNGNKAGVVSE